MTQFSKASIQRVAAAHIRKMADDPRWVAQQLTKANNLPHISRSIDHYAADKMTKRQLVALMRKHNIKGEVSGSGLRWEVEVPDERAKKALEKVMPDGVALGGYRSGHGSWVLNPNYKSMGDWNDPSSRHHYAADKTAGFGLDALDALVSRKKIIAVQRKMQNSGDQQSADLVRDITMHLVHRLTVDSRTEHAITRLREITMRMDQWEPAVLRNNIFKTANLLDMRLPSSMFASRTASLDKKATAGSLFVLKDDVEVIFDPFTHILQVGMGGEWWAAKVRPGKNVITHRKEGVDEAYKPVTVRIEQVERASIQALRFTIGGGFGAGTTVMLNLK